MEIAVPPEAAGERLDHFLAGPLGSRAQAQRAIDAGRVRVDGAARPKRHRLIGGERLEVADEPAPVADAEVVAAFEVVYEDDDLLVVDKPPGVVVHPARGHRQGRSPRRSRGAPRRGGPQPAGHRPPAGPRHVGPAGRGPHAGRPRRPARRAAPPGGAPRVPGAGGGPPAGAQRHHRRALGRDRRVRTRVSTDTEDPRAAVTHFDVERSLPGATLLRVRLETGRTHQIRAHLQAIGHPVAGDPEYGTPGLYGLERQFLHAARLAFAHPATGGPWSSPRPCPRTSRPRSSVRARRADVGATPAGPPRRLRRDRPPEVGEGAPARVHLNAPASRNLWWNRPSRRPARGLRRSPQSFHDPDGRGSRPCPARAGSAASRRAFHHQRSREQTRGPGRHQGAAGGRRALRPPDAPLEPQDAPLHLRRARRHLHHRPAQDRGAADAGPALRRRPRRARRHRPLRGHQEAGPRRRQGGSRARPACPTSTTAGWAGC